MIPGSSSLAGMSAAEFNRRYLIGTPVDYTPIIGGTERRRTRTRSGAWTLGHGAVVVAVEGSTGGMALEAIHPVEEASNGA